MDPTPEPGNPTVPACRNVGTPEQVQALAVQLAWVYEQTLWQREDDPLPADAPVYAGLFVDEQESWLAVARAAWTAVRMAG
jgi:hypothetical protein